MGTSTFDQTMTLLPSAGGTGGGAISTVGGDGVWGYRAGVAGTLVLSGGKKILQITAIGEEAAASLTINGGDTVVIPYGTTDKVSSSITIEPRGNLVDPTIIFTSTKAYFVEFYT